MGYHCYSLCRTQRCGGNGSPCGQFALTTSTTIAMKRLAITIARNRRVLESEVTKYKEGSYHPNYDWLEEYNRDPEHYRLHDFSRVCKETVNCSSSFISFSFMRYISVT